MPQVTGRLVEITGQAIPASAIPELFFRLPQEAVKGSMLLTTARVKASLSGEAFTVTLESTEGMRFVDGRDAFYVAEVDWRDPADGREWSDQYPRPWPVSDAGGPIGEQGRVIVPSNRDVVVQLETPTMPGPYLWLESTKGDADTDAVGPGTLHLVKGA
ncbi:hypothetical protein M3D15_04525 [Pseudoclavibacter alba]|uniref:Uncharacterized protein n=1 Tax=Pseudoclavibacter albus TaxID=272241 RepID=A0ABT2HWT1_9MICO|nr:hypothetical protein [Pseudoclavibacter alba]MCT2042600.1 hypothetical protein [Pseudoclavibacter alba]